MDSARWVILSAKVQHVARKFKGSLEQVFRFFAVDKANQAAVMKQDRSAQKGSQIQFHAFWRVVVESSSPFAAEFQVVVASTLS